MSNAKDLSNAEKRLTKAIEEIKDIQEITIANKQKFGDVFKNTIPTILTLNERIYEDYNDGLKELNQYVEKQEIKTAMETQKGHVPIWMFTRERQLRQMAQMMLEYTTLSLDLAMLTGEKLFINTDVADQIKESHELMKRIEAYVNRTYDYIGKQEDRHKEDIDKQWNVMINIMQNMMNPLIDIMKENNKIMKEVGNKLKVDNEDIREIPSLSRFKNEKIIEKKIDIPEPKPKIKKEEVEDEIPDLMDLPKIDFDEK